MARDDGSEQFALTLKGDGIEIVREIGPTQFAQVMNVIMGGESWPEAASNASRRAQAPQAEMSLREYLDHVRASKKPDQIVAIGHYVSAYEGEATFSREDIKARFATAREPMPANFSRDFGLAIKAGQIAEAHQKLGYYYVTKTGVKSIESSFGSKKD